MSTIYQYDLFTDACLSVCSPDIVQEALQLLDARMKRNPVTFDSAKSATDYCRLKLAAREYESFCVLLLDSQHRLIAFTELFRGTVNACSVHVREVVKEALTSNAAAVIFTHNHPSGICEPSTSDIQITDRLKSALGYFDIEVLDHIVVSVEGAVSLAERSLV